MTRERRHDLGQQGVDREDHRAASGR
jgi:hypothetical protein